MQGDFFVLFDKKNSVVSIEALALYCVFMSFWYVYAIDFVKLLSML
jgi:hypothetical protein